MAAAAQSDPIWAHPLVIAEVPPPVQITAAIRAVNADQAKLLSVI
jgi:hypothetical protein